ncbi:MAG: 6-phosphofructokinase, partial [Gammaproteobacteria bacterium]
MDGLASVGAQVDGEGGAFGLGQASRKPAHDRLFFIEVMGRDTGFIALESGIGGGVEEYVIPEVPLAVEELCSRLTADYNAGKRSAIVVVAEGDRPGESFRIAETVKQCSDYDSRVVVLGHIQRGG